MAMTEGNLVARGKTKEIRATENQYIVEIYSYDDLTAGDGAKHDILPGKGQLATETTCNAFETLKMRGIPIAYLGRDTGPRTFFALRAEMIPAEIVVRRRALGSYLARNPEMKKGTVLTRLPVEWYLKTKGKWWASTGGTVYDLPVDDPLLIYGEDGTFGVHHPRKPVVPGGELFRIPLADLGLTEKRRLVEIEKLATRSFLALENEWDRAGGVLADCKIEVGWAMFKGLRRLVIADDISNDSWRLTIGGREVSKQRYRDEAPLDEVLKNYILVRDRSKLFRSKAA